MRAAVWHGRRDVQIDTVPDPTIQQATDAIVRVTSTGLCGSDLHLYEVMAPFVEGWQEPGSRIVRRCWHRWSRSVGDPEVPRPC